MSLIDPELAKYSSGNILKNIEDARKYIYEYLYKTIPGIQEFRTSLDRDFLEARVSFGISYDDLEVIFARTIIPVGASISYIEICTTISGSNVKPYYLQIAYVKYWATGKIRVEYRYTDVDTMLEDIVASLVYYKLNSGIRDGCNEYAYRGQLMSKKEGK